MPTMDKFIIGEQYKRNDDRLRQEIKEKLGLEDGYLPSFPPYEVAKVSGYFYIRTKLRGEWDSYYTALSEWRGEFPPPDDGAVMCQCGNKTFHIKYGDYECIAVCTQCRLEHVVYDG